MIFRFFCVDFILLDYHVCKGLNIISRRFREKKLFFKSKKVSENVIVEKKKTKVKKGNFGFK